nr:UDP binding domain-containing protein [uncultured Rhodoferax sp.]
MKLTVIGTAYVGRVSGACLADVGNNVMFLDMDPAILKEGAAIEDFMRSDRIVVGCEDEQAAIHMCTLYTPVLKANTDDMRKATSRNDISDLLQTGATITACEPVAMDESKHCFPNEPRLTFAKNQTAALEDADAWNIATEWQEFRSPDFENIKTKLKHPVIFDGRNLFDPVLVKSMGFKYFAIDR